jgi:ATP-dependent RNA helicase DDX52/ROK1
MEAFQLLSRGGARFDKQRFKSDVEIFNVRKCVHKLFSWLMFFQKAPAKDVKGKGVLISHDTQLPPELDFFKYAKASAGKRKAGDKESDVHAEGKPEKAERKRRKIEDESTDSDDNDIGTEEDTPTMQKHRVTAKGSDVPKPFASFEDLHERYHVPPRLLSNLYEHNYKHPTGIQAHGIPILLEVNLPDVLSYSSKDADDSCCSTVTSLPSRQLVLVKL